MKNTNLTAAELRVKSLLILGLSNHQISEFLGIKLGTTKLHLTSIYKKLQVTGDRELLARSICSPKATPTPVPIIWPINTTIPVGAWNVPLSLK